MAELDRRASNSTSVQTYTYLSVPVIGRTISLYTLSAETLTTNDSDTGSRSTAGLHHVAAGLVFGAAGGTVATVSYSTSTETF